MDTTSTTPLGTAEEHAHKQALLSTIEHELLTCQNADVSAQLQQQLGQLLAWFQEHPEEDEEIIRALNHFHYDEEMFIYKHSVIFVKGEPVTRQAYTRQYRCMACGFVSLTHRNMVYHQHQCAGHLISGETPYTAEGLYLVDKTPLVEEIVRRLAYRHTLSTVGPYRFGGPCLHLIRSYGGKLYHNVTNDPQTSFPFHPGVEQGIDFPAYQTNETAAQCEIIRKLILDSLFLSFSSSASQAD